jgi:hypothetical protein
LHWEDRIVPSILIQPRDDRDATLSAEATGVEFISYSGTLDPRMTIRFVESEAPFPRDGLVRLRRGADSTKEGLRISDSFRYEHEIRDSDLGEIVPAKWVVYLQLDDGCFDRLVARLHWGLPKLDLTFSLQSKVLMFDPGTDWEDLYFQPDPRPWDEITEAVLLQHPFAAAYGAS